jgi:hypothetical protein
MALGMTMRSHENGAHAAVADTDMFTRAMAQEYAHEHAPAANYGFGPVVMAAFGFWGIVAVSFGWLLHH